MKRASILAFVLGLAAPCGAGLWGVGPGWVLLWLLVPTVSILAGREARRRWQEGDARSWRWMATSGTSLAWLGLLALVPGLLAFPSLMRARISSSTALTVADLREVLAAEERYHQATGAFASLECLGAPERCGAGKGLMPLRPELVSAAPRHGFARYFMAGPGEGQPPGARLRSFAYLAVPLVLTADADAFRPPSGDWALCADSTGRLCRIEGRPGFLRESRCPGPATPIESFEHGPPPPCEPPPH